MRLAVGRESIQEITMRNVSSATGHQPVEPDKGPDQSPQAPAKDEPGTSGAPHRNHHDPEDPDFDDAD
jgi:hypothetical protein